MSHFFIVEQRRQKQLRVLVNNKRDDRSWDNSNRIRDDSVSTLAMHFSPQFLQHRFLPFVKRKKPLIPIRLPQHIYQPRVSGPRIILLHPCPNRLIRIRNRARK
jgi:hypothetical protein